MLQYARINRDRNIKYLPECSSYLNKYNIHNVPVIRSHFPVFLSYALRVFADAPYTATANLVVLFYSK